MSILYIKCDCYSKMYQDQRVIANNYIYKNKDLAYYQDLRKSITG